MKVALQADVLGHSCADLGNARAALTRALQHMQSPAQYLREGHRIHPGMAAHPMLELIPTW